MRKKSNLGTQAAGVRLIEGVHFIWGLLNTGFTEGTVVSGKGIILR